MYNVELVCYFLTRSAAVFAVWLLSYQILKNNEVDNIHVDIDKYLVERRPVRTGTWVSSTLVLVALIAWGAEMVIRRNELFFYEYHAIAAVCSIMLLVIMHYFIYAETIEGLRRAAAGRAERIFEKIKFSRDQVKYGSTEWFHQHFNHKIEPRGSNRWPWV